MPPTERCLAFIHSSVKEIERERERKEGKEGEEEKTF
jgi:hypothetical protein